MKIADLAAALQGAFDSKAARLAGMPSSAEVEAEVRAEIDEMNEIGIPLEVLIPIAAEHFVTVKWLNFAFEQERRRVRELEAKIAELEEAERARYRQMADGRHAKSAEAAAKAEIRRIWATGKYSSRDLCAEEEYAALDISFSTARKALKNTPEPPRRG